MPYSEKCETIQEKKVCFPVIIPLDTHHMYQLWYINLIYIKLKPILQDNL